MDDNFTFEFISVLFSTFLVLVTKRIDSHWMTLNGSWIRKEKLLDLLVEIGIDIGNLKGVKAIALEKYFAYYTISIDVVV